MKSARKEISRNAERGDLGATMLEYVLIATMVILTLLWFRQGFVNSAKSFYNNQNGGFNYIQTPQMSTN